MFNRLSGGVGNGRQAPCLACGINKQVSRPDTEYAMVDATLVKVHRHGQGEGGTSRQATGCSRSGMTPEIFTRTGALGNLVRFVLLAGQRYDTVGVPPLIAGLAFDALIADMAFDSGAVIADLDARRQGRHRPAPAPHPTARHRQVDLQADKTDQSFGTMIYLSAATINSR